jgi:beta-N-acetylhexosaminidase
LLSSLALISNQNYKISKVKSLNTLITEPYFLSRGQEWAQNQLNSMSLDEKIAQFFMLASWPNKGEEHQLEIENYIKNHKIGGVIFFQGKRNELNTAINRFQNASKIPLLIGMDAEWGVAMRISDEKRFPFAYTIGACNDTSITENLAAMMAQECRDLGIHINFAPVADVNSNPENPVIGFRSFSENASMVSNHVTAVVKGLEKNGVLSCIKHFPGHGDTDKDSHFELPTVSHTRNHFEEVDFIPFKKGISVGVSSVMIGHLNIPNIDETGTPSSLSKKIIQDELINKMGFKGLVISDALNMKGVSNKYGKTDVISKAFQAGNDILLYPEEIESAIKTLSQQVKKGLISEEEINKRCLKVLQAKYHVLNFKTDLKKYTEKYFKVFTNEEIEWKKRETYEKAITVIKNDNILPIINHQQKIACISIGANASYFQEMMQNFNKITYFNFDDFEEAIHKMKSKINDFDLIVTSIHTKSVLPKDNYSLPGDLNKWIEFLPESSKNCIVHCGNPVALKTTSFPQKINALVLTYENHQYAQEAAAQLMFGAIGTNGKIPFNVSNQIVKFQGLSLNPINRLKFTMPEELGLKSNDFDAIDKIVQSGLDAKAFPGCQVLVAVKGKVIYRKNFGTVSYLDTTSIHNHHVYDIASISKIVGSTAALMRLETENKFTLEKQLKDYIPDVVLDSKVGEIKLKNMMAHQAGFTPWLAFYKSTLEKGEWNLDIYKCDYSADFCVPVADKLWISNKYETKIYQKILSTPLNLPEKYEYSDLGYYFAKKIIEKQSGKSLDDFLYSNFYNPMGLYHLRYLPLLFFPKNQIIPTENDTIFRKQLIHGYVHDPGAAMLGGVGGHAGIFSNSTDLAAMMQMFLNKGSYANVKYISPDIIKKYTSAQLSGNRRGAGFDRPTANKEGGPTCALVSSDSYGHSGFTGTFTWADPEYGINYVFLSNRVNPSAENKKIQTMHIRTEIQRVIYEVVLKNQKK